MKRTFLFSTLILALILIIVTCTKEYSYEGGPMAAYTLAGSPDTCTNPVISDNFFEGAVLDSSNNIRVQVQVTLAGNYIITTNTADGISFSATGNFPDTGLYDVTLAASGTPQSAGIYQFQISDTTGCYFSLEVKKLLAEYLLDCENPVINGLYAENNGLDNSNSITLNVDVVTKGPYSISTDTVDGIYFSASGFFDVPGAQTITLQGFGTPQQPGLIYFRTSTGTSGCSFKLPIQNTGPLATYVLESGFGNPNPCTPQSVNGGYTRGLQLSAANTVDVTVFVTVLGNFTIATDSVNGMVFQYSGQFTSTGEQTVTLKGSGTPEAIGVFTFLPQIIGPAPLGGSECGFTVNVK